MARNTNVIVIMQTAAASDWAGKMHHYGPINAQIHHISYVACVQGDHKKVNTFSSHPAIF